MARSKRPMYPLPESITPGKWQIVPHQGGMIAVDLLEQKMYLPLKDDPSWACVRAHELAHVAFTPVKKRLRAGIEPMVAQAVEDLRVNHLAVRAGIDYSAGSPRHILEGAVIMTRGNVRELTGLMIAGFDKTDKARIHMLAEAQIKEDEDRPVYDRAVELANLAEYYMRERQKRVLCALGSGCGLAFTWKRTLAVARWLTRETAKPIEMPGETGKGPKCKPGKGPYNGGLDSRWGDMAVETGTLKEPKHGKRVRTETEGAILRAPWRVTTDGRVFRAQKRAPRAGTTLIDASGSMSITADQLETLVKVCPAGQIAVYTGHGEQGFLRILARNGKVSHDKADYADLGHGNIVDGPAINWLNHQTKPRVWVCDGIVTGKGDEQQSELDGSATPCAYRTSGAGRFP